MNYRHELGRKAIHIGASVFPLLYLWMSWELALCLVLPVTVSVVVLDVLRLASTRFRSLYDRWLAHLMRADEHKRLCGASYVMIAATLCILLFPRPIAVAALLFLCISDALASLVGLKVGGPRWFDKSLGGSTAFLVSALIIGLLCLPGSLVAALAGAVVATFVEAFASRFRWLGVDDNLLIPLVSGAVMFAFFAG